MQPTSDPVERRMNPFTKRSVEHPWRSFLGVVPALVLVGGLSIAALAGVVSASLRPGALIGGSYGTDAWRRLLSDQGFLDAVIFTLRASFIATTASVALSIPLAMALRRSSTLARGLVALPLPVPHLVIASVAVLWLGPGGLVDRIATTPPIIASQFGWGVIAVYILKEVPFLTVLMLAAFGQDDRAREEAARTLGATRLERWRGVLLPQLVRPTLLGSLVVAAFVVGSTEVPQVVGPLSPDALTTWSITVVRLRGPIARPDAAAALVVTSLIVLVLAAFALWFGLKLSSSRSAQDTQGSNR